MAEIGLLEAMHSQRQITRYKTDPIPDGVIDQIIEAATKAPSGANVQPWEFVVLTDRSTIDAVAKEYREMWLAGMGQTAPPDENKIYTAARYLVHHIHEIPALIVVCVDHTRGYKPHNAEQPINRGQYANSIWLATQNLFLAARSFGLGTRICGVGGQAEQTIKNILGIPDHVEVALITPLGYPKGKFGPTDRIPADQVTHRNKWGNKGKVAA